MQPVSINLLDAVLSHGQLYTALFRGRQMEDHQDTDSAQKDNHWKRPPSGSLPELSAAGAKPKHCNPTCGGMPDDLMLK
jgi:hypothetical protein